MAQLTTLSLNATPGAFFAFASPPTPTPTPAPPAVEAVAIVSPAGPWDDKARWRYRSTFEIPLPVVSVDEEVISEIPLRILAQTPHLLALRQPTRTLYARSVATLMLPDVDIMACCAYKMALNFDIPLAECQIDVILDRKSVV